MEFKDLDNSLITVGSPVEGGACYVCFDTTKELPTDATTKMSTLAHFMSVGELSENGYTEQKSVESEVQKGWHGTNVAVVNKGESHKYKAEFLEVNRPAVAKLRHGIKNVETDDETGALKHIKGKATGVEYVSLVFDELMSNGILCRTVVKEAAITSFDDVAHQKGAIMVYGMEFDAMDKDGFFDIYYAKPAAA